MGTLAERTVCRSSSDFRDISRAPRNLAENGRSGRRAKSTHRARSLWSNGGLLFYCSIVTRWSAFVLGGLLGLLDIQFFDAGPEGARIERQAHGRSLFAFDPPAGLLEDLEDVIPFYLFESE